MRYEVTLQKEKETLPPDFPLCELKPGEFGIITKRTDYSSTVVGESIVYRPPKWAHPTGKICRPILLPCGSWLNDTKEYRFRYLKPDETIKIQGK